MTGRHSVMLKPDSVSRVRPPKITIPKTDPAEARSQYATLLLDVSGKDDVLPELAVSPAWRASKEEVLCWIVGADDCDRNCGWRGCRKALRNGVSFFDRMMLWRTACCCVNLRQKSESRMMFARRPSRARNGDMKGAAITATMALQYNVR